MTVLRSHRSRTRVALLQVLVSVVAGVAIHMNGRKEFIANSHDFFAHLISTRSTIFGALLYVLLQLGGVFDRSMEQVFKKPAAMSGRE